MASNLGELQFEISADNAKLKKALKESERAITQTAKSGSESLRKMSKVVKAEGVDSLGLLQKAAAATGVSMFGQAAAAGELAIALGTATTATIANTRATLANVTAKKLLALVTPGKAVLVAAAAAIAGIAAAVWSRVSAERALSKELEKQLAVNKELGDAAQADIDKARTINRQVEAIRRGLEGERKDIFLLDKSALGPREYRARVSLIREMAAEQRKADAAREAAAKKIIATQEKAASNAERWLKFEQKITEQKERQANEQARQQGRYDRSPEGRATNALFDLFQNKQAEKDLAQGILDSFGKVPDKYLKELTQKHFGDRFSGIGDDGSLSRHAGARSLANIGQLTGSLGAADPAAKERKEQLATTKEQLATTKDVRNILKDIAGKDSTEGGLG